MKKILLVLTACVFIQFFPGCGPDNQQANHLERIPVKLGQVERKDISIPIHTSGRLSPRAQIKLSFKTGGLIARLPAGEGSTVEKGQLLASLNLAEVDARVNQAQNAFAKARRDMERVGNLYRDKAATLEQFQNVKTAMEVAQSDLNIARFNREYSVIRAPSRGKILKKMAEVDEMVAPGYPVFIFGSTQQHWVIRSGVSERDVVRIGLNDRARVSFDAYPDKVFKARVSEISEAVDGLSGTYEVEAELQDEGLKLVAGFIGKMDILPAIKHFYAIIPVDALVDSEGDEAYVFTVEEGRAAKHKIRIANLFGDRVAVESGLEGIINVVISGGAYLDDGSAVKIVR
jgi:multidrug efflux system membrane fusion protein